MDTIKMTNYERKLSDCFETYKERAFVFVRPGGNFGDELIYLGAEVLARHIGVRWVTMDVNQFLEASIDPEAVIYIHGGGGFNRLYRGKPLQILAHAVKTHSGPVIQGPQTFSTDKDYIKSDLAEALRGAISNAVILYAREYTSLKALVSVFSDNIDLRLDHDTALHLTRDDLCHEIGSRRPRYRLLAIREDREALETPYKGDKSGVHLDPARYAQSFGHWARIHAYSKSIVTNRTHSSILGSILGIPTTLLPGSYHKNRSIWEYSLASRGVEWADWAEQATPRFNALDLKTIPVIGRFARSRKVKRTAVRPSARRRTRTTSASGASTS